MSTRCQIMFHWGLEETAPTAILYRHSDGYPDGVLPDLDAFFKDMEANVPDNRFTDPCYLSAKLLVWFTSRHNDMMFGIYKEMAKHATSGDDFAKKKLAEFGHPCDFLGHGIDLCLHDDIQFLYHIHCSQDYGAGRPMVTWEHVTDETMKRYNHLMKSADKKVKIPAGSLFKGIEKEVQ